MSSARPVAARAGQVTLIQDSTGAGTGLLVGSDGWILTNKHVAPSVGPYRVITADGQDLRGVGVHQSPHHDLAVVKVGRATPSFFDLAADVCEDFQVGDEVYALGHPRGCRFSMTRGIISNPHRVLDKEHFVQTDVSINPGNSGGPLLNAQGQLVGVVAMMLTRSQGLGFAVPGYTAADYVRHVRRLIRQGILRVPEELLDGGRVQPGAAQVVRGAVDILCELAGAEIEAEDTAAGACRLRKGGRTIAVRCADGCFTAASVLATVGSAERSNAGFLRQLLELNGSGELGSASLSVRGDAVTVSVTRATAGLDETEAIQLLGNLLRHATALPERVAGLIYGGVGSLEASVPEDPGYPLISLPE